MTPQAKTRPPAPPVEVGAHDQTLNVEQRLLAVMGELSYVQRDRVAPKEIGGFSFVSHDAVTSAVRPLLVKYGVLCLPTIAEGGHSRDGNQTTLLVDVTFVNVDRPEDQRIVRSVGYGIDKQDKGPGKAMSYAVKYALLKTFSLETGDDVEAASVERAANGHAAPPANGAAHHSPGRPALAKFWAVARGQHVPEEVIRAWFKRNLGVESTKEASDAQLLEAAAWAQGINVRQQKLGEAMQILGLAPRTIVEEAGRMFPGVSGLGELTLPEWAELIGWAETKANLALDQTLASEAADDPDAPPF